MSTPRNLTTNVGPGAKRAREGELVSRLAYAEKADADALMQRVKELRQEFGIVPLKTRDYCDPLDGSTLTKLRQAWESYTNQKASSAAYRARDIFLVSALINRHITPTEFKRIFQVET